MTWTERTIVRLVFLVAMILAANNPEVKKQLQTLSTEINLYGKRGDA